MITPDQLRAMTPEQRGALFAQLATSFYATEKFYKRVEADFDVANNTVYRWATIGPPFAVIFALDAWARGPEAEVNLLDDWREVPAQLAAAAKSMAAVSEAMARIARRLPQITSAASVTGGSEISLQEPAKPLQSTALGEE